jgi:hypothetical protein
VLGLKKKKTEYFFVSINIKKKGKERKKKGMSSSITSLNGSMGESKTRKEFLSQPEVITEINRLMRLNSRTNLILMCTDKGIPEQGSKHELATRIVLANHRLIEPRETIISKLKKSQPTIKLLQLPDGHFLYKETGLVFHKETRRVFKKLVRGNDSFLETNPAYQDLTFEDILFCRQHKIFYEVPDHLVISDRENNRKPDRDDHIQDLSKDLSQDLSQDLSKNKEKKEENEFLLIETEEEEEEDF